MAALTGVTVFSVGVNQPEAATSGPREVFYVLRAKTATGEVKEVTVYIPEVDIPTDSASWVVAWQSPFAAAWGAAGHAVPHDPEFDPWA